MKFLKKNNKISIIRKTISKQVVKNILTVGIITLLIKGIGFYKESLIASYFGLSEVLDTFFIAFLIPGFIMNVFIGAFKNVFIPNYVAELKTGSNISSFQATGFLITILVSVLFMIIAYLFTDIYLETFFPGHTEEYFTLIKSHFKYLLPCILFWGVSSIFSGLLNIDNEFRFSSFSGVFIPISIIVCLFLFRSVFGDLVLAIGTLIGSIFSFLYLLGICIWKKNIKLSTPKFGNPNVKLMFAQVPAKVSASFLTGMNGVVDQYFAAQLAIGSIAAINYGTKMPSFLRGILVISIANVLLPYFSKMILKNRAKTFEELFKILKIILVGAGVFCLLGIFLSDFLVSLFFERKKFTSEDAILVANIQKVFLIYIPFSVAAMVVVNFLTSINKNAIMAYVSFGALALNIILDYFLIQYYGILGIALCTTVVIITKGLLLIYYTYNLSEKEKKLAL